MTTNTNDNNFVKILNQFATHSFDNNIKAKVAEIIGPKEATSSQSDTSSELKVGSGSYYKIVIEGFKKVDEWFTNNTFEKLSPNLEQLIKLSQDQLSPSQGSQTTQLLRNLAEIYNNGAK